MLVLGTAIAVLTLAAAYGFIDSSQSSSRDEASSALARVSEEFRAAMGASPSAIETTEPANPEMARAAREEFIERYRDVAVEFAGTPEGTLAWLEVGTLQRDLGDRSAAIATWREAAAGSGQPDLEALLLGRIAAAHEQQDEWLEAAEAWEAAAGIESFPLRLNALADAARCFAAAGEDRRALDAFTRLEAEAPDLRLPDHVKAELEELRAAQMRAEPRVVGTPDDEPPTGASRAD